MTTILLAGGTGLIGRRLTEILTESGFKVIVLTRQQIPQKNSSKAIRIAQWDTNQSTVDRWAIEEADAIINLSGAGVADKRWTESRKKEILESRTNSGKTLVKALTEIPNKVQVVVNSSAIGWYGPDPAIPNPTAFTESDPHYNDYLGETCFQWEKSIHPVIELSKRLVLIRTGIVLSNQGGALVEFKKPLRFGLAASLGTGQQIISWIHIDDICQLFIKAVTDSAMQGIYNGVAPEPVSNQELTHSLARANNKFWIPVKVPSFVLKLVMGEMSVEVLKSTTVSAAKTIASGFEYKYGRIEQALKSMAKS